MSVLGVIPARYASTRFPGKPLARLNGKPLIQLVWERARGAKRLDELVVATDDQRIAKAVEGFGGKAVMTDPDLPSGTDRVWAAAKDGNEEIIVNIQGDEPLAASSMVDELIEALLREPRAGIATPVFRVEGKEGMENPNVVKAVVDQEGWALYFSRAPIPHLRDSQFSVRNSSPFFWYKHLGLYAYRRDVLKDFVAWPPADLERSEQLEQLRALAHGVRIKVVESAQDTIGVDTPEDLKRVERILNA